MKKFFSLVLALVMALSLTTVAWGAPTIVMDEDDLRDALAAGGDVVLGADIELTYEKTNVTTNDYADFWSVVPKDVKVTLDLAGYDITREVNDNLGGIRVIGELIINDSEGGGVISDKYCAAVVVGLSSEAGTGAKLTVNGGTLSSEEGFAISGNGNNKGGGYTNQNTTIIINDGAITSTNGAAIYHPQAGTLTINDGTVTGYDSGIAIKSGTLTINDGTVRCTGPDASPTTGYSDGVNASGAAIQIESSSDYAGNVVVNVKGGTVTSDNGAAIYEYNAGTNSVTPTTDTAVNSVSVSGGDITGKIQISSELAADDSVAVSGGTFSDDVSAYLPSNLTQTTDGVVVSAGGTALDTKYDMVTTDVSQTKTVGVTVNTFKANKPKDTNKDGLLDQPGNVKYVEFSNMPGVAFVQVNTAGEADYAVYQTGTKALFGYFKFVGSPEYFGDGVAFFDFGENCGQYDETPEVGAKYYLFQGVLFQAVDPDEVAPDGNLMVGSALTPVMALSDEFVDHSPVFTYDKDYKVVAVKCAECGTPAVLYANFASVPKADKADAVALGDGQWYVWLEGPVADTETKVESAETFDAGIAMYVGMSVMAAAGSVVVLKKKD